MRYLQKMIPFEGLQAYDGYLYRKPDALWFHACDGQCSDELAVDFAKYGDTFSVMSEELLRKADYLNRMPSDYYRKLRAGIYTLIYNDDRDLGKFYFPKGVRKLPSWEHVRRFTFSYYAVCELVWDEWQKNGAVGERAWEALAYSAYMQCYDPFRDLVQFNHPWLCATYYRQIKLANSHEDRARIMEIIRPRTAGEILYVRDCPNGSCGKPLQMAA